VNQPPHANNLRVTANYCSSSAYFQWNYGDAENDHQTKWQIQISTASGSNFANNIIFDSGQVPTQANALQRAVLPDSLRSTDTDTCTNNVPANCNFINYGKHYYWRVKVWESYNNQDSGWIYYNASAGTTNQSNAVSYLYTYAHPGPNPIFTLLPTSAPLVNNVAVVSFTDSDPSTGSASTCYHNDGTSISSYLCSASNSNTYEWWFTYGFGNGSTVGPIVCSLSDITRCSAISHNYILAGNYTTQLQICDEIGCCSAPTRPVQVGNPKNVPQWWEISPY
jgi:hypothetical protein